VYVVELTITENPLIRGTYYTTIVNPNTEKCRHAQSVILGKGLYSPCALSFYSVSKNWTATFNITLLQQFTIFTNYFW